MQRHRRRLDATGSRHQIPAADTILAVLVMPDLGQDSARNVGETVLRRDGQTVTRVSASPPSGSYLHATDIPGMISEAQIRPRTVHLGRPSMARFLIIDGDAKWRGMLRLALEADGHCIEDAETGAAGLQAFRARRHDLVMCDVTEPEQDGLETIDRLL